jgi:Pup amidohydrolase
MGIETEYGISVPGQPGVNAMVSSSQVVNAYQAATAARARRARWDFEEENPLRDARGFDLAAETADSAQLTDEDLGLANVILTNGARLYVDHAHPEYSAPECTNPLDAVIWDKAGERVMAEAAARAASMPGGQPIQLYKNNTDNKGASYGCHENYLMNRATPFADIVRHLTPFFVSRQVVCGAGRLGRGADGREDGFQISQRADFFEVEVGLETTLKRPIINTRDEPHADPQTYRRLHVIAGDANLCELATFLKVGTTAIVLAMVEDGFIEKDLSIIGPVHAMRTVSHDPTCRATVELLDGGRITAVDLQWEFLRLAQKYADETGLHACGGDDVGGMVLTRWEAVLGALERDPMLLDGQLDWVTKLSLLQAYIDRDGLEWSDPKLSLLDLQYHDGRPDRSLYEKLVRAGKVERLVDEDDVLTATTVAPVSTRAWFRGGCLARWPDAVVAANWDSLILDVGSDPLRRIPMMEPLRGTKAHVQPLFDEVGTPAELVERLQG